jgi:hypothetical protein
VLAAASGSLSNEHIRALTGLDAASAQAVAKHLVLEGLACFLLRSEAIAFSVVVGRIHLKSHRRRGQREWDYCCSCASSQECSWRVTRGSTSAGRASTRLRSVPVSMSRACSRAWANARSLSR